MKIECGNRSFDLSQDIPMDQQKWRSHLYIIGCPDQRLAGLVGNPKDGLGLGTFSLFGAVTYCQAQLQLVNNGAGKVQLQTTMPPIMLPFDTLGPVTMNIVNPVWTLRVVSQPDEVADYLFNIYQSRFDPPKVITGGAPKGDKPLILNP